MHRTTTLALVLALLTFPAFASDVPRIKLEKVVQLDKPIEVRHDPAGRLFMVEQTGRVLLFENGKVVEDPAYLDLSDKVFVAFECGLLGIAFHPKFETNGLFYASYTTDERKPGEKQPAVKSYITEFKVDPKARKIDRATERVVMSFDQPFANHNGGQIQFGPDGMMYLGWGDGGKGHDTLNAGQDPGTWLGKFLRIDPTPDPVAKTGYTVPKDNPFFGKEGWKPEIWALGQRNPWRFSFDRKTGDLWAADVGQDIWEEVNLIVKGGNYGWRIREGSHDLWPAKPTTTPLIDPVFEYYHDRRAASITGGYVYRGKKIPALQGWYICGDYSYGTIFGFKYGEREGNEKAGLDANDNERLLKSLQSQLGDAQSKQVKAEDGVRAWVLASQRVGYTINVSQAILEERDRDWERRRVAATMAAAEAEAQVRELEAKVLALQGVLARADQARAAQDATGKRRLLASGVIVNPQVVDRAAGQRPTQPSGFGEDIDGELYMCDINGWVYRIVAPDNQ